MTICKCKIFKLLSIQIVCLTLLLSSCSYVDKASNIKSDPVKAPSVTCITKLGLSGSITADPVAGKLSNDAPELIFVGTSDGLYALSGAELIKYIYIPFGVSHIALIDDVTGDGIREVVVCLSPCDVPAIRCYNGVTWEEVWKCSVRQPMFIVDMGWGDLQLQINDLKVLKREKSQLIVISSGQCVFAIDSVTSKQLWRVDATEELGPIAVVSDVDKDKTDDFVVGNSQGFVFLISGEKGKIKWKYNIAPDQVLEINNTHKVIQKYYITDTATLDITAGLVLVASSNGTVYLLDVNNKHCRWESLIYPVTEKPVTVRISTAPDITGDDIQDVLVLIDKDSVLHPNNPISGSSGSIGGTQFNKSEERLAEIDLLECAGGKLVWNKQLYIRKDRSPIILNSGSSPFIIAADSKGVPCLVDLKTGNTTSSLNVPAVDFLTMRSTQLSNGDFIIVSDISDVLGLSPSGKINTAYPRIVDQKIYQAKFNSDDIPDLLISCQSLDPVGMNSSTMLISAVDGTTHQELWRYGVPYSDFTSFGGLNTVQITADLTGDGIQDVIACRGKTVFVFSGEDGSLSTYSIDTNITAVSPFKVGAASNAILITSEDSIIVISATGNQLWKSTLSDWGDVEVVWAVGDINQDQISDLCLIESDKVVTALSNNDGALNYTLQLSVPVTFNKIIIPLYLTADINNDGIPEIAYYECDKETYLASGTEKDKALFVISSVDGQLLLKLDIQKNALLNLACADFNDDGFKDSLVYLVYDQKLQVISGKDGIVIRDIKLVSNVKSSLNYIPAVTVQDATGDNIADLAVSEIVEGKPQISIYDLVTGVKVKEIGTLQLILKDTGWQPEFKVTGFGDEICVINDLNNDGKSELVVISKHYIGTMETKKYSAIVDIAAGKLFTYFPFADFETFDSGQDYIQGIVAAGGLYLLNTEVSLQLTNPGLGQTSSSPVAVVWQDEAANAITEIFVDGMRHALIDQSSIKIVMLNGQHDLVIRSVDNYGKITYANVVFNVKKFPWATVIAFPVLLALILLCFYSRWVRVHRNRRAQKGMENEQ